MPAPEPGFISAVRDLFTAPLNCDVTVDIGDLVYISAADTVDKASADDPATSNFLGFVVSKPTPTTCVVQAAGEIDTLSGLDSGVTYYLSDTPGEFSDTPGTESVVIGVALSDVSLIMVPGGVGLGGGSVTNPFGFGTNSVSAILLGGGNTASGLLSVAHGSSAYATGFASHAEGASTRAKGFASHAEGTGSYATGTGSHSEGNCAALGNTSSHAEGYASVAAGDFGSHAEGWTEAIGNYSHAEGEHSQATANRGHAEGHGSIAGNTWRSFTAVGTAVTIAGGDFTAEFTGSNVIRFFTRPSSGDSTPMQRIDSSISASVFNVGPNTTTFTAGLSIFAKGRCVKAGNLGVAPDSPHAEGFYTQANATGAHSEGYNTLATGLAGHAEGQLTLASADFSHAGGKRSVANKTAQFARGSDRFSVSGDAQWSVATVMVNTTGTTSEELTIDGAVPGATNRFTIDDTHSMMLDINILAYNIGGTASACFKRRVLIKRAAGTLSLVTAVQTIDTDLGSNAGAPPVDWTVVITADDVNKSLQIVVTGSDGSDIRWLAQLNATEVSYPGGGGD